MLCTENESGDEDAGGDAAAVARRANAAAQAEGEAWTAEEAWIGCASQAASVVVVEAPCACGAARGGRRGKSAAPAGVSRGARGAVQKQNFRICHLSLQRTHIHLLVEADDRRALSRGMQSFQISAAKHLNRMISKDRPGPRRRGPVFADRYYAEIIQSPLQARRALSYVLNNWRKHCEDRDSRFARWDYDWFSSGWSFPDWAEFRDDPMFHPPPQGYEPLLVRQPTTWLLATGWKKHGLISYREVPSAH